MVGSLVIMACGTSTRTLRLRRVRLCSSVPRTKGRWKKCEAPVEFVDVYPTLADICGLAIAAGLDGMSLRPWLENPAEPMKKVAISQYPRSDAGRQLMGYSIRDERWRLTLWRDRNIREIVAKELYDEQSDPAETVNLAEKQNTTV